jgi:hypothetical protein
VVFFLQLLLLGVVLFSPSLLFLLPLLLRNIFPISYIAIISGSSIVSFR